MIRLWGDILPEDISYKPLPLKLSKVLPKISNVPGNTIAIKITELSITLFTYLIYS